MKWNVSPARYMYLSLCVSSSARSTLSSERKRCSVALPLTMSTSLVCTMPRQLPGVTCMTLETRYGLPLCRMTFPTLIWVATGTARASAVVGMDRRSGRLRVEGDGLARARRRVALVPHEHLLDRRQVEMNGDQSLSGTGRVAHLVDVA